MTSSSPQPASGEPASFPAWLRNARSSLRQASCTALPRATVWPEPPTSAALGIAVSPRSNWTRSSGSPRVSAASWVITVQVPTPISAVPLQT